MAVKIVECPWCGGVGRITYEENQVYQMRCSSCGNTVIHRDRGFDAAEKFFMRVVNLEKAAGLVGKPYFLHFFGDEEFSCGCISAVELDGEDIWLMDGDGICRLEDIGKMVDGKSVYLDMREAEKAVECECDG